MYLGAGNNSVCLVSIAFNTLLFFNIVSALLTRLSAHFSGWNLKISNMVVVGYVMSDILNSCILPPLMRWRLCDHSICQSVNRITNKRGNGRPNLVDMAKG